MLESRQGFQLLCLADIHVGSVARLLLAHKVLGCEPSSLGSRLKSSQFRLNSSQLHLSRPTIPPTPPKDNKTRSFLRLDKSSGGRTCLLVGNADGALGALVPVDERVFRRLSLLQQIMSTTLKSTCALNPREFRLSKAARLRVERKKGVLDGRLLWSFVNIESSLQEELTAAMGTTVEVVLENLLEIDLCLSFF